MQRRRVGGIVLAGAGGATLAVLFVLGSLRHPVDAVAETTPVEYLLITIALTGLTIGLAIVLATYVAESKREHDV